MKTGKKTLEIMNKAGWYNNWLLKQFKKNLNGEILEIGAGIGNFTAKLGEFDKVTAIDYDNDYKNANYGDIEKGKYFFRKKRFDTIVCINVLEHIKADGIALKNMFNLLNKNGKLILLVPAFNFAYCGLDKELGHFRRYTTAEVYELLVQSKYSVLSTRYLNWLGLIGWFASGKILGRRIISEWQLGIFDKIARPFLLLEELIRPAFGLSVLAIGKKK